MENPDSFRLLIFQLLEKAHYLFAHLLWRDHRGIGDIAGKIDFALAFAVVHEVPDKERLLSEIRHTMKEEGRLLIVEPKTQVSKTDFDKTISIARSMGFEVINDLAIRRSHAVLLGKKRDKNKS